ncbi:hypothetical protein M0R04_14480 [Candidatus Dojkabacteria bacterium]|jgi:hypothetical protein|nr:hypothetical protein [Candidatus Dojkabacteria bacterium]
MREDIIKCFFTETENGGRVYIDMKGQGNKIVERLLILIDRVEKEAYDKGYSEGHKDNLKVMGMKIPKNVRITKL